MRMDDGFSTLITFSLDADVQMWEKGVTPPGVEGGGEIDTTTMHNVDWRTAWPKQLKKLKPITLRIAWESALYQEILDMANKNQEITVTFPDGSTIKVWGWLDDFSPGELVEGEQPEADVTLIPSMQDNDKTETAPTMTDATTTTTL